MQTNLQQPPTLPTQLNWPMAVLVSLRCLVFFNFCQIKCRTNNIVGDCIYYIWMDPIKPDMTIKQNKTYHNQTTGCSIADELLTSFENLLRVAARRGITYDRIVVENSGVAEPQNIRDQFSEATALGHPLMQKMYLDTLITVVDGHTFIKDYSSKTALANRPDLGEGGGLRPVVDLLVEQIEYVSFGLLNLCFLFFFVFFLTVYILSLSLFSSFP